MRELTVAIDLYDRHLPLFMGLVPTPDELNIKFLEVGMAPPRRNGINRHRRMLVEKEFDVAEVSLASYIVAKDRGMTDLIGLPVFPRRLFSHNHLFVSERSGIKKPSDLVGKKIAIWAFQVTMSVLAKGDLLRDFDVPWQKILWKTQHPEEIPIEYGDDVNIEFLGNNASILDLLQSGEIDGYINPHPPERIMTPGCGIHRLFEETQVTSKTYMEKYGYLPIMHLLVVKKSILESNPSLGKQLISMFEQAKEKSRGFYVDPGFTQIPHVRIALEHQISELGSNLWPSGVSQNYKNLEDFIGYCVEQRLIPEPIEPESLFHPSTIQ
ncbi:MAG TPA: taurine ABC transporter substrate-binding protein [Rhodospirillales bacterium]|jgi:4,5-dihydroxyphthalate decarboxylase|nr:taurine ABC transporter substrate-binding protein [Rhodospirillales bacterium]